MLKLAHIVNPVHPAPASDLAVAQPVTFETMRVARRFASGTVDVELYTTHYPEDAPAAPADFRSTPELDRSVLDVGDFRRPRRLPLLADVLARLYDATDAAYLIYTNVDIGLMPHFYVAVHRLIESGLEAFVVNRRTIERAYDRIDQLPLMYASTGRPHRGWDCFVFPRNAVPEYDLGAVCIGAPRSGLALLANLMAYTDAYREFKALHLTFHRGDDRSWSASSFSDYRAHNTREVVALLKRLEQRHGAFARQTPPGAFLFRKRYFGPLYETWARWSNVLGPRSAP